MPKFGATSSKRLSECHPDLIKVLNEAIKFIDFAVVCGHRSKEDQDKALAGGFSKLKFPASKHNKLPSLAVDIVPFPSQYSASEEEWQHLAYLIKGVASTMGISIDWGGDWKKFLDRPHFELKDKK